MTAPARTLPAWMQSNLAAQGYSMSPDTSRALRLGLRLPSALCLVLVVTGLALQSAALILAVVPIGAVAGWSPRHPFDLIWNYGLRHLTGAPELPPNPAPRRHAFKIATVWLGAIGALLAVGATIPALTLGWLLVAVCGWLTATNYCIPSALLGIWWRWRQGARLRANDPLQSTPPTGDLESREWPWMHTPSTS